MHRLIGVIGDPALHRISKKYSSPPVGEEEGGRGAKLLQPAPTLPHEGEEIPGRNASRRRGICLFIY